MRIRVHETLVVVLLTLTVTALTSAFHIAQLTKSQTSEARRQAQVLAQVVAGVAAAAIEENAGKTLTAGALDEHAELRQVLDRQLAANANVVFVGVFLTNGDRLATSPSTVDQVPAGATDFDEVLARGWIQRLRFLRRDGALAKTALPLMSEGKQIAQVVVVSDAQLIRNNIDRSLGVSARIALVALGASVLVAFVVVNLSRRPIRALSRQIERMRLGDSDVEAMADVPIDIRELSEQLVLLNKEVRSEGLDALARKVTAETVLDHLQDAILMLDEKRCVLFFNKSCAYILGRSLAEVRGHEIQEVLDESHPLCRAIRLAEAQETSIQRLPCTLPTKERFRESLVSIFRLADCGGTGDHGLLVLAEDLGSLETFQALVSFGAQTVHQDQMTRGVLHEVRNPLNAIGLHLQLLRDEIEGGEAAQHHFEMLEQSVHTLHRVVEGFLDYVRRRELVFVDIDMVRLVQNTIAFLGPDAAARGIEVSVDVEPPLASVKGDESVLRQALLNLLKNALEAVERGGHVRVLVRDEAQNSVVQIEDDGVGIAPEDLEKVFELYYTTKDRGNGIGLSVAQRLVTQHGGRIAIESEFGRGTTVSIYLPHAKPADGDDAKLSRAASEHA